MSEQQSSGGGCLTTLIFVEVVLALLALWYFQMGL